MVVPFGVVRAAIESSRWETGEGSERVKRIGGGRSGRETVREKKFLRYEIQLAVGA